MLANRPAIRYRAGQQGPEGGLSAVLAVVVRGAGDGGRSRCALMVAIPPPTLPEIKAWRPRNADVALLLQCLARLGALDREDAAEREDAADNDAAEARSLLERLREQGKDLVAKHTTRFDGCGGYSVWGWRVTSLRLERHVVAAWRQRFTAEASPPSRKWLTYYFSDPEPDTMFDDQLLEAIGATVKERPGLDSWDDASEVFEY